MRKKTLILLEKIQNLYLTHRTSNITTLCDDWAEAFTAAGLQPDDVLPALTRCRANRRQRNPSNSFPPSVDEIIAAHEEILEDSRTRRRVNAARLAPCEFCEAEAFTPNYRCPYHHRPAETAI